jgi:hypothetical protein
MQITKFFDSVGTFSTYLSQGITQPAFKDEDSQQTGEHAEEFSKTANYREANELFMYGDRERMKLIQNAGVSTKALKLNTTKCRRELYSSVCGVFPHVPNAVAGVPTSMINIRQTRPQKKVLNVCYSMSCSHDVKAADMITAASRFVSACQKIEAAGVRTNIYLAYMAYDGKHTVVFAVRIKSASQPFNVLKIAYPLIHPSMLRRHMFRALEITPDVPECFASGYGYPIRYENEAMKALGKDGNKIDSLLSYYDVNGKSISEIEDMLTKTK